MKGIYWTMLMVLFLGMPATQLILTGCGISASQQTGTRYETVMSDQDDMDYDHKLDLRVRLMSSR